MDGFTGEVLIPSRFTPDEQGMTKVRSDVATSGQIGQLVANDLKSAMLRADLLEIDPQTGGGQAGQGHAMTLAEQAQFQQLLLERELHQVVCRYARLCDERDWAALDGVFSATATADYGGWQLRDRAAIAAMLRNNLGGCGPTQHLLGNLRVERDGDELRSRVAVRAAHRGAAQKREQTYECMGEYHDRWVQTPAGWRIAHRRMVVTLEFGSRGLLGPATDQLD